MPANDPPHNHRHWNTVWRKRAINLRKHAEGMPHGIRRDELLRKAHQIDFAIELNEWLTSRASPPDIKNSQRGQVARVDR